MIYHPTNVVCGAPYLLHNAVALVPDNVPLGRCLQSTYDLVHGPAMKQMSEATSYFTNIT